MQKTKLAVPRAPKPKAPESKELKSPASGEEGNPPKSDDLKSPASGDNETERFALYVCATEAS